MKMKSRSYIYDINRPKPRHGQKKYSKYQVSQYDDVDIY